MDFKKLVSERYAVKTFDPQRTLTRKQVDDLLQMVLLAPSSFNIQPWKIIVISNKEMKEKLSPLAWSQPQITSCSHLLVFCANTDIIGNINKLESLIIKQGATKESIAGYVGMMQGFAEGLNEESKKSWAQRQTYIALGNAVNGAKELGFDSSPMEGFNPDEFAKVLNLPKNIVPVVLCAIGYATDKPRPKVRFPSSETVEFR